MNVCEAGEIIYKDNDVLNLQKKLYLDSSNCETIRVQLLRDVEWLEMNAIMDYSLCVGIHNIEKGNNTTDYKDLSIIGSGYISSLGSEVYYLGIIDILQQYNAQKKMENTVKSIAYDSDLISSVNPNKYAARFRVFMMDFIR
jgi:hypothetical protein